jgi:hypothetical protein
MKFSSPTSAYSITVCPLCNDMLWQASYGKPLIVRHPTFVLTTIFIFTFKDQQLVNRDGFPSPCRRPPAILWQLLSSSFLLRSLWRTANQVCLCRVVPSWTSWPHTSGGWCSSLVYQTSRFVLYINKYTETFFLLPGRNQNYPNLWWSSSLRYSQAYLPIINTILIWMYKI